VVGPDDGDDGGFDRGDDEGLDSSDSDSRDNYLYLINLFHFCLSFSACLS
jgi:hypothetical protein